MTNGEKFLQVYGGLPLVFYSTEDNITDINFPGEWWEEEYNDTGLSKVEAVEQAKRIKEFCIDRNKLEEDPCEGCPFKYHPYVASFCKLNYGLFPKEWFNLESEGTDE